MNDKLYAYLALKLGFIILGFYLFYDPIFFLNDIYSITSEGLVIFRGMSLIFALYEASRLVDILYKDIK